MTKVQEYFDFYKEKLIDYKLYKSHLLKEIFDETVQEEAELIKKLSPNSDNKVYMSIYYYLVWNGYFSANHQFVFDNNTIDLLVEPSISIASGNGVCRNLCAHLKKILEVINKKESLVLAGTKYGYKRKNLKKAPEIERNIRLKKKDTKSTDSNFPNHVEILDTKSTDSNFPNHVEILDTKQKILYDPSNFSIQKIINQPENPDRKKMIDLGIELTLNYDIEESYAKDLVTHSDYLEKELSGRRLEKMSLEARYLLRQEGINICKENEDLIESHQRKMQAVYQYIKKETIPFKKAGY